MRLLKHLWDPERNRFVRRITVDRTTGAIDADVNIDASLFGVFQFGMLPADDPMVVGDDGADRAAPVVPDRHRRRGAL